MQNKHDSIKSYGRESRENKTTWKSLYLLVPSSDYENWLTIGPDNKQTRERKSGGTRLTNIPAYNLIQYQFSLKNIFADQEIPQEEMEKTGHHLSKRPKNQQLVIEGYIYIYNQESNVAINLNYVEILKVFKNFLYSIYSK